MRGRRGRPEMTLLRVYLIRLTSLYGLLNARCTVRQFCAVFMEIGDSITLKSLPFLPRAEQQSLAPFELLPHISIFEKLSK